MLLFVCTGREDRRHRCNVLKLGPTLAPTPAYPLFLGWMLLFEGWQDEKAHLLKSKLSWRQLDLVSDADPNNYWGTIGMIGSVQRTLINHLQRFPKISCNTWKQEGSWSYCWIRKLSNPKTFSPFHSVQIYISTSAPASFLGKKNFQNRRKGNVASIRLLNVKQSVGAV